MEELTNADTVVSVEATRYCFQTGEFVFLNSKQTKDITCYF